MEAASMMRFSSNIQGAKKEKTEVEARVKAEFDIRKNAEKTRKRAESKVGLRERTNYVHRAVTENETKFRVKAEAERAKIERS